MTLETKNLLIGMVAGFAFGLVVCSGVHAEPGPIPCDPPRTGMACYLTDTNDDGPSILWDAPRLQTPCERTMAEHVTGCGTYKNPATAPKPAKVAKTARLAFKTPGFEPIGGLVKKQRIRL